MTTLWRSKEALSRPIVRAAADEPQNGGDGHRDDAQRLRDAQRAEVQAVGAGAANQAIKSIAIARGYLAPMGIDLVCIPAFTVIEIDGVERTAMKLIVETR